VSTFSYFNVTTTAVTTLSSIETITSTTAQNLKGSPNCIAICNKDSSGDECTIDLYLDSSGSTSSFYILHDVVIPGGSTLILEKPEINYDSSIYALKFKLTSVAETQLVDIKVEY